MKKLEMPVAETDSRENIKTHANISLGKVNGLLFV